MADKQVPMLAKFNSNCAKCGKAIKEGGEIFYIPATKKAVHRPKCPGEKRKGESYSSSAEPVSKLPKVPAGPAPGAKKLRDVINKDKEVPKPDVKLPNFSLQQVMKFFPAFRLMQEELESKHMLLDEFTNEQLASMFKIYLDWRKDKPDF